LEDKMIESKGDQWSCTNDVLQNYLFRDGYVISHSCK
jgi:hypothetical protein